LFWSWIVCLGLGVVLFAVGIGFAVPWALAASRIGSPPNTTATYGIVTAAQGSTLQVHVSSGTVQVERTQVRTFNQTSNRTTMTHALDAFDATVTGAPPTPIGNPVSFTYGDDPTQGTYLAVAPSRVKAAGDVPVPMVASFVVGFILGLIGVILLVTWLVKRHRGKSGAAPGYIPPPGYGPPGYGPPGYAPQPGYGPPPGYTPQPGYTPPPPVYRPQPGYGPPPGYPPQDPQSR